MTWPRRSSTRWSESQRALLKEIVGKYDTDQNGKLEPAERETISAADQARLRRRAWGGRGGRPCFTP